MVLGPFPERKGLRLPGRDPATLKSAWTWSFDKRVRRVVLKQRFGDFQKLKWVPAKSWPE